MYNTLITMIAIVLAVYSLIITVVVVLFFCWDIGNFVRTYISLGLGRMFQRKYRITETTVQYGKYKVLLELRLLRSSNKDECKLIDTTMEFSICTTRDVDLLFTHMNNARCLRAVDFARNHFYDRTVIFEKVFAANGAILVGASTIRYRKPLPIFSFYKIETKMLCWDKQTIFLEHKLITLNDDFVRAVVLSRNHIVGLDLETMMADVPGADTMKVFPEEVTQWQLSLETMSARLRKKDLDLE